MAYLTRTYAPEERELDRLLRRSSDTTSTVQDQVAGIVGGMNSPTVTRLMEKGWISVQTVVAEDLFWDVFEQLKALGAQGILVTPIEKMTE